MNETEYPWKSEYDRYYWLQLYIESSGIRFNWTGHWFLEYCWRQFDFRPIRLLVADKNLISLSLHSQFCLKSLLSFRFKISTNCLYGIIYKSNIYFLKDQIFKNYFHLRCLHGPKSPNFVVNQTSNSDENCTRNRTTLRFSTAGAGNIEPFITL